MAAVAFGILTAATAAASSFHALLFMHFINGILIGGLIPLAWALNIEFVPRRMRSTVVTVIMVGYSVGGSIAGIATLCCAVALWLPHGSARYLMSSVNTAPVDMDCTSRR